MKSKIIGLVLFLIAGCGTESNRRQYAPGDPETVRKYYIECLEAASGESGVSWAVQSDCRVHAQTDARGPCIKNCLEESDD